MQTTKAIPLFWLCNGKKTGKRDDVTFLNAIFGFSNICTKK